MLGFSRIFTLINLVQKLKHLSHPSNLLFCVKITFFVVFTQPLNLFFRLFLCSIGCCCLHKLLMLSFIVKIFLIRLLVLQEDTVVLSLDIFLVFNLQFSLIAQFYHEISLDRCNFVSPVQQRDNVRSTYVTQYQSIFLVSE